MSSKRLTSAALETDTTAGEQLIPLQLDADRLGCTLGHSDVSRLGDPHVRRPTGSAWLTLDGVDSGAQERWEVEAIPDTPPTVTLKQPAADLFLTPHATRAAGSDREGRPGDSLRRAAFHTLGADRQRRAGGGCCGMVRTR